MCNSYHVDLSVGVAHVANDGAVLHAIQLVSGHHVLVPCGVTSVGHQWQAGSIEPQIPILLCIGSKCFFTSSEVFQELPVQVMMISTRRMTSFSLTTLNPSILGQEDVCEVCVKPQRAAAHS